MRNYFERYHSPGKRHPYLLVSRRALAATARRLFDNKDALLVKAHRVVVSGAVPAPSSSSKQFNAGQTAATVGAAYLSALYETAGQSRKAAMYGRRARKALLAFAEMGLPERAASMGYLRETYLVGLAFAYDLAWETAGWTRGEREVMKRFFNLHSGELLDHMHRVGMSNHAAWSMCRLATTGALFRDEALLSECLDGPESYAHRVAHEFFDDGMTYEQSTWGYQVYSLMPVTLTALAAHGAGARPDPLTLKVDNDLSFTHRGDSTGDVHLPFYPCDEREFPRPKEKSLSLALTAFYDMLRPDTTCPSIGDYGQPTPPVVDHWTVELAWDFFGDRRAARLLSMGERAAVGMHYFPPYLLTLAFGKPLPKRPRFETRSVIYPHAGHAVLKSVEGDAYWGSDAVCALVKFGPYGNGHGHGDKLHLDIAGAGHKCCIEEIEVGYDKWPYSNSTVSHNTVVAGGRSQPGDEEMYALNDSCGRLLFHRFDESIKIVSAEAPDVYDGLTTYRRTAALIGSCLLDIFEVEAEKPTTFDWFLHGRGRLSIKGASLKPASLGYRRHGYQFLRGVRKGKSCGPLVARFSPGHAVLMPEDDATEVFCARGSWKATATRPVLILRRRGTRAVFVVVHDPSGKAVKGVRLEKRGNAGLSVTIDLESGSEYVELRKTPPSGAKQPNRRSKAPWDIVYLGEGPSSAGNALKARGGKVR
ncbi:MAG: heparinase II/III family protein [Planctomycetes bacterium]|nr:heparinase II/III family protein [Planctomycetota bacterium]